MQPILQNQSTGPILRAFMPTVVKLWVSWSLLLSWWISTCSGCRDMRHETKKTISSWMVRQDLPVQHCWESSCSGQAHWADPWWEPTTPYFLAGRICWCRSLASWRAWPMPWEGTPGGGGVNGRSRQASLLVWLGWALWGTLAKRIQGRFVTDYQYPPLTLWRGHEVCWWQWTLAAKNSYSRSRWRLQGSRARLCVTQRLHPKCRSPSHVFPCPAT